MQITVELLIGLVSAFFGAGWFGQFLLARYSKTKRQRDIDIAKEYLSLAKLSVDEFEKRINLVVKLDEDQRTLSNENFLLKQKQIERDKQLKEMESKQAALQSQIDADARDRADLRRKFGELDIRYRALFRYLLANLEHMRKHDLDPVEPPEELQSDPDIIKFVSVNKKK